MAICLEKAPIVIDGANVAYAYGSGGQFQLRGILLAVAYFQRLKHKVTVILPPKYRLKCEQDEDETGRVLRELQSDNILSFAPSGSNDDDFVIQRAVKTGSFILSCDKFEEEKHKHPEWRGYVENYRLNFTFVNGDDFTPNPTPLGPNGPTLKQFLNRRPRPLTGEVNVLDAVSKSNQQLLSEIIRVSRQHAGDTGTVSTWKLGKGAKNEEIEEKTFVTRNPFQLLSSEQVEQDKDNDKQKEIPEEGNPQEQLGEITVEQEKPMETPPASDQPAKEEENDKQKSTITKPSEEIEESPFQHIVTGCGTVVQSDDKSGLIQVDENFSTNPCKKVEFYPYACLSSILEGKMLSDEVTMAMIDPVELMNRYPVGTEVGFVAAFIEGFCDNQETASALQICAKNYLLDGYGHCDYESIFSDHTFLVSKSGQLHWSPCCDSSLLLFRNAFIDEPKQRRLEKMLNHQDWLEYKSMPTPAVALFDACPIVVKANYLRLTGLIVRLSKEHGVIRSAKVNDFVTFKNTNSTVQSVQDGDNAQKVTKKRPFKVGDWVQFRIRKQDTPGGSDTKGSGAWKAINVQLADKPLCVCDEVEIVDCLDKVDNFRQKKKSASRAYALKVTGFGYVGTMKPRQGVLWCQAIGRVYLDPTVLIDLDLSQYPPGSLVKFEAIHRPNEKSHERKDTVWYTTHLQKPDKNEASKINEDDSAFSIGLYRCETAMVDHYDNDRRWAGLHGRESRYILYDRFDDVLGRDDGKMKNAEAVKVTYVDPPVDSPLYIAIAVEPVE